MTHESIKFNFLILINREVEINSVTSSAYYYIFTSNEVNIILLVEPVNVALASKLKKNLIT